MVEIKPRMVSGDGLWAANVARGVDGCYCLDVFALCPECGNHYGMVAAYSFPTVSELSAYMQDEYSRVWRDRDVHGLGLPFYPEGEGPCSQEAFL